MVSTIFCLNNSFGQVKPAIVPAVSSAVVAPVNQSPTRYELKDSLEFISNYRLIIPGNNDFAEINVETYKSTPLKNAELTPELKNYLLSRKQIQFCGIERFKSYAYVNYSTLAVDRSGNLIQRFIEKAQLENLQKKSTSRGNKSFVTSSVLANGSGKWYKLAVTETGIYKIDYAMLQSMGINPDTIHPGRINIYGNSSGQLPEVVGYYSGDDLIKNNVYFQGEGDGVFNSNDYLIFYGKAAYNWNYNYSFDVFLHQQNYYSDTSFYFLNIANSPSPKRIPTITNTSSPNLTVDSYDYYLSHEQNLKNFIKSGRIWVGEEFDIIDSRSYSIGLGNLKSGERVKFHGIFTAATPGASNESSYDLTIPEGGVSRNIQVPGFATGTYSDAAESVRDTFSFFTSTSSVGLNLSFNKFSPDSKGWLDYFVFNSRNNLVATGRPLFFRDIRSVGAGNVSQFNVVTGSTNLMIWNVTNPGNSYDVGATVSAGTASFVHQTDSLHEFVAFELNSTNFNRPAFVKEVAYQNLHALSQVPYLIITNPSFLSQATELGALHASNGLPNHVVTTEQIYNEFSSGMRDAAAIRNYIKMFYERAGGDPNLAPKYVLLFGDGSYDNKGILGMGQHLIPTFQSVASFEVIQSYTSDDYYALMDNNENVGTGSHLMDVGVGRLVAKSTKEADALLKKIKDYVTNSYAEIEESCCNPASSGNMGPWRNKIVLIADDEDGAAYVKDCEKFDGLIKTNAPQMEVQKIYCDATTQTVTPGGERYYEAEKLIRENVEAGALIVNYVGHGGEVGWAHERILDVPTINDWNNDPYLPVFVTATCEFSRYDDPYRTSAGEFVLLNPNGGCVSMLTTTRLVFSGDNSALNTAFYQNIFDLVNDEPKHLGEVIMLTKNLVPSTNTRNFTLLGDPGIQLKLPFHRLVLDSINDIPVTTFTDTVKALSIVKMSGHVEDVNGNPLNSFNGISFPKVYDKIKNLSTLGQNTTSTLKTFKEWKNLIFKGRASVVNGKFEFSFVVPKDLDQNVDTARFVAYANDNTTDGNGHYIDFRAGGINFNAPTDNLGPEINVYLNDEKFVDGGKTDETPYLIIKLYDENGINTVGTGIGHDISAVLDNKTSQTIILNEFYEADKDTYKSGKVKYQFDELEEGEHTLKVKSFDVYNNSAEQEVRFVVSKSNQMALDHVLNYPNPFTTNTEFMFEHNQSCTFMNIQIQIFTVTGKLVKTIDQDVTNEGYRVNQIFWDGKDDFGDKLARGTYIYRLRARANEFSAEKIERLVILY